MQFDGWGAQRWANHFTHLLNAANPPDRYRFDVGALAMEFSRSAFPQDPIMSVGGSELDGFEGALLPSESGKRWGILYASGGSPGRRRFTVAHEFGHYLLHRRARPEGFRCGEAAVDARDGVQIEREANDFASTLLMPFDDFRAQLPAKDVATFDTLSECAERYDVSLAAVILRWLRYTDRRSMIIVSRDGFMKWAWSSEPAFKSGRFFRTSRTAVAVPAGSAAAQDAQSEKTKAGIERAAGVWFDEKCCEMTVRSNRYDLTYTLLHFGSHDRSFGHDVEEATEDTYDRFVARS